MTRVTLLQLGVVKEISMESSVTFVTISCLLRTHPLETRSTPAAAPATPSGNTHSESGRVVDDVTLKSFLVRDSVDISYASNRITNQVTMVRPTSLPSGAFDRESDCIIDNFSTGSLSAVLSAYSTESLPASPAV